MALPDHSPLPVSLPLSLPLSLSLSRSVSSLALTLYSLLCSLSLSTRSLLSLRCVQYLARFRCCLCSVYTVYSGYSIYFVFFAPLAIFPSSMLFLFSLLEKKRIESAEQDRLEWTNNNEKDDTRGRVERVARKSNNTNMLDPRKN